MNPDKCYLTGIGGEDLGFQGRRNEPAGMVGVARAVAECYSISPQELAKVTTANAIKFYNLR